METDKKQLKLQLARRLQKSVRAGSLPEINLGRVNPDFIYRDSCAKILAELLKASVIRKHNELGLITIAVYYSRRKIALKSYPYSFDKGKRTHEHWAKNMFHYLQKSGVIKLINHAVPNRSAAQYQIPDWVLQRAGIKEAWYEIPNAKNFNPNLKN